MSWFCPSCGNMLLLQINVQGIQEFYCQTCPYVFPIIRPQTQVTHFKRKEVDDVLGGAKAWENVDSTEATCPKCENGKAFFMQIQTRSADEPMTIFYKCTECGFQWREQ
ncbi:putative Rpc11-DNA-directed RNA polymerase III subunit C11 [Neocallimastix lanati (nom. inval.)]|uniref:DNA-directed RNA polymerase subunit n=1 Tax=Neocallimastix californiae TaxID=1754190 RepID=A0A1Y1YTS2_9FUNG|nr:putative Rpc11-DNA-directed RNA polymerase III subunit C11 [Neocallimastix sp. JGI-2020a]ORY01369.1 putative Rpc11-DNA-directed RNA polymerase III subunit C11 [Neocallimastix californiae]|eukprot:ORY01369.1 putative Rpc11-DNA-directed RNA polymerase III subunit C11 [Neocallimastix californiae]